MDYDKIKAGLKDVSHLVLLLVLIIVFMLVLSVTGIVKCGKLPFACDLKEAALGKPKVLIVFGHDGLGDPDKLQSLLSDPNHLKVVAQKRSIDYISLGNLDGYDLVIVDRAATMSTDQLKIFTDYAVRPNARLIWIGDSGTRLPAKEASDPGQYLLYDHERRNVNVEAGQQKAIGPWARKDNYNNMVNFDWVIGVDFISTFCEIKSCSTGRPFIGNLKMEKDHPLVYGMSPNLSMKGDFALVKLNADTASTLVMTVDYESMLKSESTGEIGQVLPIIVQSGIGGRVAYYAVPPENLVDKETEQQYYSLIENMYLGILGYI